MKDKTWEEKMKEKIRARMAKIKMNLHNNGAGRSVAIDSRRLSCKCHGVSGSCSSKTCWYEIPKMEVIGHKLKKRYDDAKRVSIVSKDQGTDQETVEIHPRPSRRNSGTSDSELVIDKLLYLYKSPDFCTKNPTKDILGTTGRECNISSDSRAEDSCETLCCGRGMIRTTKTVNTMINKNKC